MSSQKHTPGPWKWEEPVPLVDGTASRALCDSFGITIVRHHAQNWTVSDAHARLIAAAPQMLEALGDYLDTYNRHGAGGDVTQRAYLRKRIEAIVDAAKGEEVSQ